jgi:hypothetical protein
MKLRHLFTDERELSLVWRVTRGDRISHLAGTAHFFPYSFKRSLTRYIQRAQCVLLEGPLDRGNMNRVVESGSRDGVQGSVLHELLDARTIARLNREFGGARCCEDPFASLVGALRPGGRDALHTVTAGMRPWMAFFTVWVAYLEKRGWVHHMDMDAMNIAHGLGRRVHFLEEIGEQITALEGIPLDRIVAFLSQVNRWEQYSRQYVRLFLKGDLEAMLSLSHPFPSRCESVINRRDRILHDRMGPFLEQGRALALVGAPHTRAITRMLEEDGFEVQREARN